ncbi:peptidoglycan D,D-transpeptidase FtsI family protein [Actinoallomurus soli]|uniref:peptidoglycan D,D-transpeptidase FtsI family protein n=1 Tax=Actinoallomurus soli TaxID=2952535 RepID=UPI0020938B2A|nr:penicillin-binding protein 2 [Actinoallomurus soli]MCO5970272.1 penicillin-binding protein 2 [Actinoallomurus soli]
MNKPLRKVAVAGMLLLVILIINVNYIQGSQADKLQTDPLNSRQFAQQWEHNRGPIMAGKVTLAYSEKIGGKDGKEYQRHYNQGTLYSPITGYVSVFSRTGLESAENGLLDGTDKRLALHNWFDMLVGKKAAGATVQTTIDPDAQQAAYSGIKNQTIRRGGAVAIDVKTGAILAMASFPSYDTNDVAVHDGEKANKVFESLNKQKPAPMLNYATRETFAPGSSFKIIDSAAAIESGQYNKDTPTDANRLLLPESGQELHNSDGDEAKCNGSPPLIDSFAASCNSTFGRLALTLKQQTLENMAAKFGFNKPTEIENGVSSATSVYPTKPLGGDSLARSGIGQEVVTASPLQMAMVAQTVANGGKMMKPYLVKRVVAQDQSELVTAEPKQIGQPISADTAGQIQEMMRAVVDHGTASAVLAGRDIAGKTGTAETGIGGINEDWFVGFAPRDNPKVAFAVVTEGPAGSSGAKFSAPIAWRIVQAVH